MLSVRLLGQFAVECDDRPVALDSHQARVLFAYLVTHADVPLSREYLASLIWPESSSENARSNLRHALWRIRSALGCRDSADGGRLDYLISDAITITFVTSADVRLDVRLLEAEPEQPTARTLIPHVAVYRGEFMPGFYESWVTLERERLAAVFDRKMETLLEMLTEEGNWDEVIRWSEHWIAFGEVPEAAFRALMRAHAHLGHTNNALAAYRRCCERLRLELETEPSILTHQLAKEIAAGATEAGSTEYLTLLPTAAHPPAGQHLSELAFERARADLYLHQVRRLNRLVLALAGALAVAGGVALASRRRQLG